MVPPVRAALTLSVILSFCNEAELILELVAPEPKDLLEKP
jgi:hypothetical protein